LDLVI